MHLSTYYLKFEIVFLKFIVGLDGARAPSGAGSTAPRTFQSFRDQVPKCTAEASTDEVAVDEVPMGRRPAANDGFG